MNVSAYCSYVTCKAHEEDSRIRAFSHEKASPAWKSAQRAFSYMIPEFSMHSIWATEPVPRQDVTIAQISQRTAKAPRWIGINICALRYSNRRRSGKCVHCIYQRSRVWRQSSLHPHVANKHLWQYFKEIKLTITTSISQWSLTLAAKQRLKQ